LLALPISPATPHASPAPPRAHRLRDELLGDAEVDELEMAAVAQQQVLLRAKAGRGGKEMREHIKGLRALRAGHPSEGEEGRGGLEVPNREQHSKANKLVYLKPTGFDCDG